MIRHYYVTDDADELVRVEEELMDAGLDREQLQVLHDDARYQDKHRVSEVDSIRRRDVIRTGFIGLGVGLVLAAIVLGLGYFTGVEAIGTWVPFIFLSVLAIGFCTWEGGMYGIHKSNVNYRRFEPLLKQGYQVLLVDMREVDDSKVNQIMKEHPRLVDGGVGPARPFWWIGAQKNVDAFIKSMP